MVQSVCISELSKDTSSVAFDPLKIIIPKLNEDIFNLDNASKFTSNILFPYLTEINVKGVTLDTLIIPQADGSFAARVETENFCANGQGENEAEVLRDIKEAVAILLEEAKNPSGDVPWPNDYR